MKEWSPVKTRLGLLLVLLTALIVVFVAMKRPVSAPPVASSLPASSAPTAPALPFRVGWSAPDHYVGPAPKRLPQLRAGQQFLCMPDTSPSLAQFKDAVTGKPVSPLPLGLRVFTLKRIVSFPAAPMQLEFAVEGTRRKIMLRTDAPVGSLPGLLPLDDDASLDHLRRAYEGRQVWCYGGDQSLAMTDSFTYTAIANTPLLQALRIRRIVRLALIDVGLAIGSQTAPQNDAIRQALFTDDRPLVVVLGSPHARYTFSFGQDIDHSPLASFTPPAQDPTPPVQPLTLPPPGATPAERKAWLDRLDAQADQDLARSSQTVDPVEAADRRAAPYDLDRHVLGEYFVLADTWDFERRFSLRSPQSLHLEWSRQTLKEIIDQSARPGMSRDMVAWSLGYGNSRGTLANLQPMPSWSYDSGIVFDFVTFDQHGRVSAVDDPVP